MNLDELVYDWNHETTLASRPLKKFELNDETLRDGLQNPSVRTPSIEQKLEILHLMHALGVQAADIGLPGAGPHVLEHVIQLATEIAKQELAIQPNCAARTVIADIEPIVEASQKAGISIQACTFIGSSPIRQYAEGWSIDKLLQHTEAAVTFAVKNNLDVMFVTEDTTRSNPEHIRMLYKAAINAGARRVCISDTVGHITPRGVRNILNFMHVIVNESGENVRIDWHGHNDRGLGIANALTAIMEGADRIHATALGIGERTGNVSMDQLMVNLKMKKWIDNDLTRLLDYVRKSSEYLDVPIPFNYPIFGKDAFRTGTGVHAAAILKALDMGDMELVDKVYSSVPANDFGLEQIIEVGPMSGLSNVTFWLKKRGIEPKENLVKKIFSAAKNSEKILSESEILAMCNGEK